MDKLFQNITLANLIAISGLIIACISLGWNILNELRRTPRARVHVMIAKIFQQDNPRIGEGDYLSITISNIGSRPLKITNIGYWGYKWWQLFKRSQFIIIPRNLPVYIKDGEEHNEMFAYTPDQFKELLDNNIQCIFALDSSGRMHKISRLKMLGFKKDLRKYVRENI